MREANMLTDKAYKIVESKRRVPAGNCFGVPLAGGVCSASPRRHSLFSPVMIVGIF